MNLRLFITSILFLGIGTTSLIAQKVVHLSFDDPSLQPTTTDSVSLATFNIDNHFNRPERIQGVKGNALRLDGWTTWVREDNFNIPNISNEITIEAWHATESFTAAAGGVVSQINGPAGFSIEVTSFGEVIWAFHADGQFYLLKTTTQLAKYQWNHIVVTADLPNQVAKIYINGVEEESLGLGSHANFTLAANTPLYVGRQTNNIQHAGFTVSALNGALDEVSIYNNIVSAAQITANYNQLSGAIPDLTIDPAIRHQGDNIRPQYHAMPNTHWTNEPYGLTYYNGKYHLFFQKNPNGPYLHFMHWGHLISTDLVTWTEEKIPIGPDLLPGFDDFGTWSGTTIKDANGVPQILYTGVDGQKAGIGLASPLDTNLIAWSKYMANPVIPQVPQNIPNLDFRDPWVYKSNGEYLMIVGSGRSNNIGGHLFQFKSTDLVNWTQVNELYAAPQSTAGVFWEMPFFYKFNATDYILFVLPIPFNGQRAKALYWIGTYNATTYQFTPNDPTPKTLELIDENLLAPALGEDEFGRPTYIGIIPEDRDVYDQIAAGWRQTFSIPRLIRLLPNNEIGTEPHPNIRLLRNDHYRITNRTLVKGTSNNIPEIRGNQIELDFDITPDSASIFTIKVYHHQDDQERVNLTFNTRDNKIFLNRLQSSLAVTLEDLRETPFTFEQDSTYRINIFLDHSIVEVFINDTYAFSCRAYPTRLESDRVDVIVNSGSITIDTLDAYQIANTDTIFTGIVLSTKDIQQEIYNTIDLKIQPNPNNGNFQVVFDNPLREDYQVKIIDSLGRVIYNQAIRFSQDEEILPFNMDLAKGIYFLQVEFENGTKTERFVIK